MPAVRITYNGGQYGLYDAVLSHLGTADQLELVAVERMYDVALPDGRRLKVPARFDGVVDSHAQMFPGAARGIESFFRLMLAMHEQGHQMPMTLGLHNLDETAARFPEYFAHRRRTMDDVAREHIPDDVHARFAVEATWPYQGAVPSRLGFATISGVR